MTKHNAKNERIKREYFAFLKDAKGHGEVACERQGDIIRALATPQEAIQSGVNEIAEAVFKKFCDSGVGMQVR